MNWCYTLIDDGGVDSGFFLSGGQTNKEWHKPAFKENNEEKDVGLGNHIMRIAACFTSTPINHIVFFFFRRILVILEIQRSSGGRGAYPLHPSPKSARDRPLEKPLFNKRSLSVPQEVYKKNSEKNQGAKPYKMIWWPCVQIIRSEEMIIGPPLGIQK